jgi:hypothetical protein
MKRRWAERREQQKILDEAAKQAVKAEYERRKGSGELTWEEQRRERRNLQKRKSRSRWKRFCSSLHTNLVVADISAFMGRPAKARKPTLDEVLKIAGPHFKITEKRKAQLRRILDSVGTTSVK